MEIDSSSGVTLAVCGVMDKLLNEARKLMRLPVESPVKSGYSTWSFQSDPVHHGKGASEPGHSRLDFEDISYASPYMEVDDCDFLRLRVNVDASLVWDGLRFFLSSIAIRLLHTVYRTWIWSWR